MKMKPENWFKKELQLILPSVYPFYFRKYKKWMLVRDFSRRVPGITDYDALEGKNFIIELILEDEKGNPIKMDGKLLKALRLMRYRRYKYKLDEILRKMDEPEDKMVAEAEAFRQLAFREFLKTTHRLEKVKTFDLGG